MTITITLERPDTPDATTLINELEAFLTVRYPQESRHGYSIDKLLKEGVAFFITRHDGLPAGCGGIQLYSAEYGEIKRMYVRPASRGLGLGKRMLEELSRYALDHGVTCLRLETGIFQTEAIGLYEQWGFYRIPPFGSYREDPLSIFFEKLLT